MLRSIDKQSGESVELIRKDTAASDVAVGAVLSQKIDGV